MNKTIIALTFVALLSGCDIQTPKFQAVSSGGKTYILNNNTGEIKELPSATNEGISKGISAEVLKKYVDLLLKKIIFYLKSIDLDGPKSEIMKTGSGSSK